MKHVHVILSIFVSLLLTVYASKLKAQTNTFRINYDLALFDIPIQSTEALTNGNYIFSGVHANFLPIVSSLTQVDASGTTVWSKRYSGSISYQFGDFKKDPAQNRYYACGGSGNGPAFLIFLDNNGNFISGKDFSIAQADGAFFNRVIKTSDGGYVCVGYVIAHDPDGSGPEVKFNSQTNNNSSCNQSATETISSPLIVKFDATGNHQWHHVFRYYVTSAVPANRIYNDGSFVDVVEVTDGYIAVGNYDVNNVFSTFNNDDCEDTTPQDAVILKTSTAGAITYFRQLDNPSNATNQSSKTFSSAAKTAAGLPIFSGTDGSGRPCLMMRLPNSGAWANPTWIRKFGATSFFGTYDPFLPSRIFETSDGNYGLWLNYLTLGLPPSFNNALMKVNPSTNAALWTRRYTFNLATILPHGEQTSDGGYLAVAYTLAGSGHDIHVIKTDQDGNMPSSCAASNVTVSSEQPTYTYGTPIYNAWNNSTVSNNNITTTVTPVTPTTNVQCIEVACTAPTFSQQPSNQTICPNGTATLTATASSGPLQWQYNNNGTWSNVANGTPTGFTYANPTTNSLGITSSSATPGTYEFRLQAGSSACQANSSTVSVTVVGAIQSAPTGAQCSGATLNFAAIPNSNATYSWSVGAPLGTTATPTTGNASTFSFTAVNTSPNPENFAITVVITSNGVTCSQDLTAIINPAPFAGNNGSTTVCAGQSITSTELFAAITNNPQSGGTWSPSPAGAGTYTYSLTNACGSSSSQVLVTEINCNTTPPPSDTTIFDFTGGDQTYTVPTGVTCLDLRMWAGGGGSADNSNGGYGGGAAYVGGRLNVTPGQVLTIRVGGGGAAGTTGNNTANGTSVYPNGGVGRQQARGGGNGGGFSAIFLANTPLAIAGAGGGGAGSGSTSGNGTNYCGGVGAEVGQNGNRGGERNGCTQGAGGCGGNANGTNNNCLTPNSTFANGYQGGNGESGSFTHGGAGGGGGYAGGQGGASGGNNSGGGGGGSSFFSGTQLSSFSGNTTTAGNATDFFNQGLYGGGGLRSSSTNGNTGNPGQNGRIVLIVASSITPTFTGLPQFLCPGDPAPSLPTTSSNGVSGTWNPATVNTSVTTTYNFTPASTECAQATSLTITILNNPVITSTNGNNTICSGSSLTLSSSPAQTYQWFRDGVLINGETNQTLTVTQSGSYTVQVGAGTCSGTSSAFVVDVFNPVITSQGGNTQICNNTPVVMSVSGGDSFQWLLNGNPINGANSNTFSATTAGNYTVQVGSGSCSITTPMFVVSAVNPQVSSANGLNVICDGGTIVLNASGGNNYQWLYNGTPIVGATSSSYTATQIGAYTVQITSGACVAFSAQFLVGADAGPVALFYPSNPVFNTTPQIVSFVNASSGATQYFWEFGDGATSTEFNVSHLFTNTYNGATITLTAISENGCSSQSFITIDYAGEDIFYVPNTFTPDGDQFNQTFLPIFSGNVDPYNFHFMVFNRWGQLIWESFDPKYGWDGTYNKNGIPVQQGSYVWKITYKLQNNDKRKTIAGHLNLLR